jgi:transcriptional regulator with XRE-family HTH domain
VAPRKSILIKPAATEQPLGAISGKLGARVRALRLARGWLLADLSQRCGIAISTLSKVENSHLSLNYDRLSLVAEAFGLTMSEFLATTAVDEPSPATARISWAKAGSGTRVETGAYVYNYLCDKLRAKALVPIVSQCLARTLDEFGPLLKHDGEEFIYVLRGRVEVHTEFYGPEILEAGEGVYLDSRMGHAYLNAGEDEAWILAVNHGAA